MVQSSHSGGGMLVASTSVVGFKFGSGDAADNSAVGAHIEVIVVPFAGGRAFEDHRRRTTFYHVSHSNAARKQGERARWSVVVSLALEKHLFLNVRRKRPLVSPFGKKFCDINERHNPF